MKVLKLALAMVSPLVLTSAYLPQNLNTNSLEINELRLPLKTYSNGDFRLSKQSYYKDLFSKKELKKLAKAEKFRQEASEGMVMAAAYQKQAEDLKKSGDSSKKTAKQLSKLLSKASAQELKALKAFEKASDIYREVYTNELNNKTFSSNNGNELSAKKLAKKAQIYYEEADKLKESITSENTLEVYRSVYSKLNSAVYDQEIAFAAYQDSSSMDLSKYIDLKELDTAVVHGEVIHSDPVLKADVHYDFDKDINLYRFRYHEFEDKLKVSEEDKAAVLKIEADEANAITYMQKAEEFGSKADTLRIYSSQSTTLAEREYYEQNAQEQELKECSYLVKGINAAVKTNNAIFQIYQKYVPNVRNLNDSVGKNYEQEAETLFALSKSYEEVAAKQMSKIEQYTQLSEGNEVKLQAIRSMENAIESYLGGKKFSNGISLATGATDKHNDIAMDFLADESDGAVPVKQSETKPQNDQPKTDNAIVKNDAEKKNDNTQQVADNKSSNDKTQQKDNKNNVADKNNTSNKNNVSNKNNTSNKNNVSSNNGGTSSKSAKNPVAYSNAAVVSTWSYNRKDERLMPYKYPSGTIFSVEVGQYKEMPEPVEFPSIETFLAQNLKNQTYMRYYLGTFKTYDAALAAVAMAKNEGYKKATVVAFVNGKKSDVNSAKAKAEKTSGYKDLVQKELKQLNANQKATTPAVYAKDNKSVAPAIPLTELPSESYLVQIASLPTLLDMSSFNVSDLYYDRNDAGLYRYYTAVSTDLNIASTNLQTMKQSGYEDAYLIKVVGGKNVGPVNASNQNKNQNSNISGTVYRVQIGAFLGALNGDAKKKIDNLKAKGYTVHTSTSGQYTVYTVGDCPTREQAEKLKKQLMNQGFNDSYIATFVNGKKQN